MAKNKKSAHRPVRNEELGQAMRELRRSSATSRHTLKARKGTRSEKLQKVLKEYS